ncbi:MAG TPA: polyphenol oxidase family protein [Beutenbergiaceae bacterium]|nr:polyphenol oxidase family protein [Beutenbergiaceae bacterium]
MTWAPLLPAPLGAEAESAGISAWFTTRAAGNLDPHLASPTQASSRKVEANRQALDDVVGHPIRYAHHVHGVEVADGAHPQPEPRVDAWCATQPGAYAVLAADCLPILLADSHAGVVGAVHAGRVGVLTGVVRQAIAAMCERGARKIRAVIGPSICGRCYEISPSMARELGEEGQLIGTSRWGGPSLDLPALATSQMRAAGVEVDSLGLCTLEDERFFSHRSTTRGDGRHGGIIALNPRP